MLAKSAICAINSLCRERGPVDLEHDPPRRSAEICFSWFASKHLFFSSPWFVNGQDAVLYLEFKDLDNLFNGGKICSPNGFENRVTGLEGRAPANPGHRTGTSQIMERCYIHTLRMCSMSVRPLKTLQIPSILRVHIPSSRAMFLKSSDPFPSLIARLMAELPSISSWIAMRPL